MLIDNPNPAPHWLYLILFCKSALLKLSKIVRQRSEGIPIPVSSQMILIYSGFVPIILAFNVIEP